MPGRYILLEHTADLRVRAEGGSPAEVVEALLRGIWRVLFGREVEGTPIRWRGWSAPGDYPPHLAMVELLSEALFLAVPGGEVAVAFEGDPLSGRLGLLPLPAGTVPVRELKAVTYNEARFEGRPGEGWIAEVTLDL